MTAPAAARPGTDPAVPSTVAVVRAERRRRHRRWVGSVAVLAGLVVVLYAVSLCLGDTVYTPVEVWRVVTGHRVPGASFTVGELRLPRASLGLLAGAAFGFAGVSFQTMLRNPLASPDVIGISSGASAAAVLGLLVFGLSETAAALVSVGAGLLTALAIYLLAWSHGVAGTRLILIGIAVQAMLQSLVSYVLLGAAAWDVQLALRWLSGSLNGTTWTQVVPLAVTVAVLGPLLLAVAPGLELMRLGDDPASGLGVRVERTRIVVVLLAVGLCAVATACAGPIAFVAFLAGPIATRVVGAGTGPMQLPAALVGALLVLVADLLGQFAFGTRYPVGVLTGVLGAPYLIYLLVRTNRSGGSL